MLGNDDIKGCFEIAECSEVLCKLCERFRFELQSFFEYPPLDALRASAVKTSKNAYQRCGSTSKCGLPDTGSGAHRLRRLRYQIKACSTSSECSSLAPQENESAVDDKLQVNKAKVDAEKSVFSQPLSDSASQIEMDEA